MLIVTASDANYTAFPFVTRLHKCEFINERKHNRMIEYVEVDGFKSLRDFRLDIRPGLNVFVGPNGAGKTNILKLFEFVSLISTNSISDAVSKAGGAGEIFTRLGSETIAKTIRMNFVNAIPAECWWVQQVEAL